MASSRNNTLEFSSAGSQILATGNLTSNLTSIGAIQVLTDTVLHSNTAASNVANLSLLASIPVTIPAGTVLYGQFTAVQIVSGSVACHVV